MPGAGRAFTASPNASACGQIVFLVIATGSLVLLGVQLGADLVRGPAMSYSGAEPLLERFARWDARHYVLILEDGYGSDPVPAKRVVFFPAVPLLARGIVALTGLSPIASLLVVSHTSLVAAALLLFALLRRRDPPLDQRTATLCVLCLLLLPTGVFFRMAYTESTFLLLTVLAMYGMTTRWRPVVVAAVIGLATATRPTRRVPAAAVRLVSVAAGTERAVTAASGSVPPARFGPQPPAAAGRLLGTARLYDLALVAVRRSGRVRHIHAPLGAAGGCNAVGTAVGCGHALAAPRGIRSRQQGLLGGDGQDDALGSEPADGGPGLVRRHRSTDWRRRQAALAQQRGASAGGRPAGDPLVPAFPCIHDAVARTLRRRCLAGLSRGRADAGPHAAPADRRTMWGSRPAAGDLRGDVLGTLLSRLGSQVRRFVAFRRKHLTRCRRLDMKN